MEGRYGEYTDFRELAPNVNHRFLNRNSQAGLFSATVTSFIIESYKLLKTDPTEMTNNLLSRLLVAQTSGTTANLTTAEILELNLTTFVPRVSAITINVLWFLSLSCSLGAALCTTLVQKWVRDYLQRIQFHNEPLRRARMRAFLFDGTQKWRMDVIVEYIPTLLHASLLLFFVGLIIFLSELSIPVSLVVAAVTLVCLAAYVLATIAPMLDTAAPYETLLTGTFWSLLQQFLRLFNRVFPRYSQFDSLSYAGKDLATIRTSLALNPKLSNTVSPPDAQIFIWARAMITGDHELELFLESIPGFLSSEDGCMTWTNYLTTPKVLSSPSFQIRPSWTDSKDDGHLQRELEPLSRLLNLLEPSPEVEVRSERLSVAFIYSVPYPDTRPILTDLLGPFSTVAFILEDIRHGARIVTLLDLVMKFKTFAPRTIEPHTVREMIDAVFSETYSELKAGSQVLYVAVLRMILDWEREKSPIQPCPFSDSDITILVGHLKDLSYKLSLETAERLFGLLSTDASHQVSDVQQGVPAGRCKAAPSPPQNGDSTLRIQAVYSHVLAQRAKLKSSSS
ncbi:hypothetical protein C0992_003158 [Termitomyces sp. T32_za158]|nr:hypothetical protein C0992_003158 [Termitomyces sp. T32_za158]